MVESVEESEGECILLDGGVRDTGDRIGENEFVGENDRIGKIVFDGDMTLGDMVLIRTGDTVPILAGTLDRIGALDRIDTLDRIGDMLPLRTGDLLSVLQF